MMASLDGTLNMVGMSLELLSVYAAGLALPHAEPIRRWMRTRLVDWLLIGGVVGTFLVLWLFTIWSMVLFSLDEAGGVSERWESTKPLLLVSGPVAGAVIAATTIGIFLMNATEEALRRILLTMGTVFGTGILLQLIAAATP